MSEMSKTCRICLSDKKYLYPLFDNSDDPTYGEMLNNCADVKVYIGDGLPSKICCLCRKSLKSAYIFRKKAEESDSVLQSRVKFLKYIGIDKIINGNTATKKMSFNTISDIKSELDAVNAKSKPKPEIEIKLFDQPMVPNSNAEPLDGEDIVICNTVIRKVEPHQPSDLNLQNETEIKKDFLFDDDFDDDPRDEDYVPSEEDEEPGMQKEPAKTNFTISTLEDVQAMKDKETIEKTKENKNVLMQEQQTSSLITYYPISENGEKGQAVLLRRPRVKGLTRENLRRHRINEKTKTSERPRTVPKGPKKDCCPVCGILTHRITKHMFQHAEKKPFQCEECPRSFVNKSCYEVHVKKHKGIKDHICDDCGAAFWSKKGLVRHLLIHKSDRPYACDLCPRKFYLAGVLKQHLTVHAGLKPHKCTECWTSFNTSNQLRTHMIMHTGERRYACKVCDVTFGYKVNLNNHVTRVHGINLRYKSIHTLTEELLESELEAMSLAKKQAEAVLTVANELQPQPVPDDQITTQIAFDGAESE